MKKYFNKLYLPAMLGAAIEYYDIALYGYMAPILVPIFLPHIPKTHAYFYYFLFEFFAAIFQVIGAKFFGKIGDNFGRKKAMYYCLLGTSSISFLICILPTYNYVGIWATIMFALCRGLQCFFLGGEYNGGAIYCLEHENNQNKHGLVSGLYCALTVSGIIAAATITTIIHHFGNEYFRLAYVVSFFLTLLIYFQRRKIKETPEYLHIISNEDNIDKILLSNTNSKPTVKNTKWSPTINYQFISIIIASIFFGMLYGLPTRIFNAILPIATGINTTQIMLINTLFLGVYMILLVFFGKLSDRIGTNTVMKNATIATIFIAYPVMYFLETKTLIAIIVAKGMFSVLTAAFIGPFHAWAQDLFITKSRYSNISIAYSLGKCCSTLLLAITILMFQYYENISSLSIVLIITAIITLRIYKRRNHETEIKKLAKVMPSN